VVDGLKLMLKPSCNPTQISSLKPNKPSPLNTTLLVKAMDSPLSSQLKNKLSQEKILTSSYYTTTKQVNLNTMMLSSMTNHGPTPSKLSVARK